MRLNHSDLKGKVSGMLDNSPLVSIITVVFNGHKHLEKTIQSVIGQTYKKIEFIIIDGGSTDGTIEIIEKYQDYIDYWVSEPDNGIADAFNKGIRRSTGDLIGLINADDWYEPETVQTIVDNLKSFPAIYSGHMNLLNSKTEQLVKVHKSNPDRLPQTMRVAHPSTFIPISVYKLVGEYSTEYRSAMDYDFLLRAKALHIEIVVIDKVLSNMRLGGISKNIPMILKEELMIKNRLLDNTFRHLLWYLASLGVFILKRFILKFNANKHNNE
jgi:glycosyltransferase involved in cell wall biosynthesis